MSSTQNQLSKTNSSHQQLVLYNSHMRVRTIVTYHTCNNLNFNFQIRILHIDYLISLIAVTLRYNLSLHMRDTIIFSVLLEARIPTETAKKERFSYKTRKYSIN